MVDSKVDMELQRRAEEVRRNILDIACMAKSAHVGSSLSCVDLVVALYFHEMRIDKKDWSKRDIFIMSKGHAAMTLYSTLTAKGIMSKKTLHGYMQNKGTLPAHLDRFTAKGIEVSAGSLGHGICIGAGMAHGFNLRREKRRVFVVMGDGESEEGSVWETALFASKLKIDNLTVLLDYNNLQGYGHPRDICSYEPVEDKWRAFGWETVRADGHDFVSIRAALKHPHKGKPKIIIADTTKGKGVPFMENEMKWHYFIVTDEIREQAMSHLCRFSDAK